MALGSWPKIAMEGDFWPAQGIEAEILLRSKRLERIARFFATKSAALRRIEKQKMR
jgi:hypothetical protein